jgi:hypothetical protein
MSDRVVVLFSLCRGRADDEKSGACNPVLDINK